jgi:MFS transporter, DHA2 family, multidrug resistance protein
VFQVVDRPRRLAEHPGRTWRAGLRAPTATPGDPLLDLGMFSVPAFAAALTTNVLSFFVGFGPMLTRRARPVVVIAGGLALAAVGVLLLTRLGSASGLALLVTGSVVCSLALAPVDTLATDLAAGAAPPERAGPASALAETSAELGGALGIAILGVTGTAAYRSRVADAVPAGLPPDAAAAARATLGGAMATAGRLPDQLGAALLGAARQAFAQGLHLAFAVSAALLLAVAVLATALLRRVRVG